MPKMSPRFKTVQREPDPDYDEEAARAELLAELEAYEETEPDDAEDYDEDDGVEYTEKGLAWRHIFIIVLMTNFVSFAVGTWF